MFRIVVYALYVNCRLLFEAFNACAECKPFPVWRYFGMIGIDSLRDFFNCRWVVIIVQVGYVSADVATVNKFYVIRTCLLFYGFCMDKRFFETLCNFPVVAHPKCIGNVSKGKPETDIFGSSRRCYSIDIAAAVRRKILCGIIITSSFENTFCKVSSIRGANIVGDRCVTEHTHPIVYPFHGVSEHVAETRGVDSHSANGL